MPKESEQKFVGYFIKHKTNKMFFAGFATQKVFPRWSSNIGAALMIGNLEQLEELLTKQLKAEADVFELYATKSNVVSAKSSAKAKPAKTVSLKPKLKQVAARPAAKSTKPKPVAKKPAKKVAAKKPVSKKKK